MADEIMICSGSYIWSEGIFIDRKKVAKKGAQQHEGKFVDVACKSMEQLAFILAEQTKNAGVFEEEIIYVPVELIDVNRMIKIPEESKRFINMELRVKEE